MLLEKIKYEFLKLELDDLSIIAWICERHPKALYSFLESFIQKEYQPKGITFDIEKLYYEIINLCDGRIKND